MKSDDYWLILVLYMSSIPFLYNDIETHAPGNYSSYSVQPFFDSSIASVEKKMFCL